MEKLFNNKRMLSITAMLLALFLLFVINIFSHLLFKNFRLDLTDKGLFTLSMGTKNILNTLQEPITLKFYYSRQLARGLAPYNNYANRIEELLHTYQRLSHGKLNLEIVDPEPFSDAEDVAIEYGLQGVPLDESGANFYFGLVGLSSTDIERTIPFFNQERAAFLEYDLTQLVYQLEQPHKPHISVISSLSMQGGHEHLPYQQQQPAWQVWREISALFSVDTLDSEVNAIPEHTDTLLLLAPKKLSSQTLYAIDQFVMSGGHVLAFLDAYSDTVYGGHAIASKDNEDFSHLLQTWGVNFVSDKVLADKRMAKQVWYQHENRQQLISYPLWFDVTQSGMKNGDIVTGDLNNITVSTPGYFTPANESTHYTPLLSTSEDTLALDAKDVAQYQKHPETLMQAFDASGKQYDIAIRLEKPLVSAFPDGPPDTVKDTAGNKTHLKQSKQKSNILLVADTDLLQDRFWLRSQNFLGESYSTPIASNGYFALNALDNLTGSNDLISVRTSGEYKRPFTRLIAIQQQAETRFRQKEQALSQQLKETEEKLAELNDHRSEGGKLVLSAAQNKAVDNFRQTSVQIRKELRLVQLELRKDIESIQNSVKMLNIALMPFLVGFFGLGLHVYRRRRYTSQANLPQK